jgi:hypothetical protein
VSVETFESCQSYDGAAKALEALTRQLLYSHMAHELVDAETAEIARESVGWEYVVGAAAVIPDGLRSPRPKKDRAGVAHSRQQRPSIVDLDDQVFGRVIVADCNRCIDAVYDDDS